MRVCIYQPQYFPRLHYINRILDSDIFIFLDSAQYTKVLIHLTGGQRTKHKSYQSHAPIKTAQGEFLLSVPVKHQWFLPINETEIDYDQNWIDKHLATIQQAYQKAPFFEEIYPGLEEILNKKYSNLAKLNIATTFWALSNLLGYEPTNGNLAKDKKIKLKKIYTDKETGAESGEGSQWIADLCKSVGADEQIHGETSKVGYTDTDLLATQGIRSVVQNWRLQKYPQLYSKAGGFLPNLSIIDLLMNVSRQEAKTIVAPQKIKL